MRVEPPLQPITGEAMSGATAVVGDDARLDIVASGLWGGRFERTYFDVRVFNPYTPSNRFDSITTAYQKHETLKKRSYEQRICEVERSSFVPLVLSVTGGLSKCARTCLKRLASLVSNRSGHSYNQTISCMRVTLSFALLRSSLQCLRGHRSRFSRRNTTPSAPVDLVLAESGLSPTMD